VRPCPRRPAAGSSQPEAFNANRPSRSSSHQFRQAGPLRGIQEERRGAPPEPHQVSCRPLGFRSIHLASRRIRSAITRPAWPIITRQRISGFWRTRTRIDFSVGIVARSPTAPQASLGWTARSSWAQKGPRCEGRHSGEVKRAAAGSRLRERVAGQKQPRRARSSPEYSPRVARSKRPTLYGNPVIGKFRPHRFYNEIYEGVRRIQKEFALGIATHVGFHAMSLSPDRQVLEFGAWRLT
jgi:hypothetical protein